MDTPISWDEQGSDIFIYLGIVAVLIIGLVLLFKLIEFVDKKQKP